MQAPRRSSSHLFSYKKHSIVLMAVVSSNYQLNTANICDAGHPSNGRVFAANEMGQALDDDLLNIAPPRPLYGDTKLF